MFLAYLPENYIWKLTSHGFLAGNIWKLWSTRQFMAGNNRYMWLDVTSTAIFGGKQLEAKVSGFRIVGDGRVTYLVSRSNYRCGKSFSETMLPWKWRWKPTETLRELLDWHCCPQRNFGDCQILRDFRSSPVHLRPPAHHQNRPAVQSSCWSLPWRRTTCLRKLGWRPVMGIFRPHT